MTKRRDQALLLYTTAFAAIIGFSDKISHKYIPILTLSILSLASFTYAYNLVLQNFCTSYLIEKFKSENIPLYFERGYISIFFERRDTPVPIFLYFLIEPYCWLVCINLTVSYIYSFSKIQFSITTYDILYIFFIFYGHLLVLFCARFSSSRNISFFREKWIVFLREINEGAIKYR